MSDSTHQEQINHGEELYQRGKIDEALKVFEEVLEKDPENVEALNDLAVITSEGEKYKNSAEYLLTALKIDQYHPDVLANVESLLEHEEIRQHFMSFVHERQSKQKTSKTDRKILSYLTRILNIVTNYQAAVANLDITPKIKNGESLLLQGFAGAPRQAKSALTPLNMQVLLLEDKNYSHSIIVTADIFGFDAEMVKQVRELLKPWGIPPEQIVLNASHTHYAPGTVSNVPEILGPFYNSYANAIVNAIIQSLESLYNSLEPCLIYAGQTKAKIGVNRRLKKDNQVVFGVNSQGYYEEHTPFLLLDFIKTSKSLVLVNHGCHPTGYNALDQISADYPIYMREFMKKSPDIDEAMFLQGAAGTSKEAIGQNGSTKFTSNPGEVALNGQQLANAINQALSIELKPVTGDIFGTIQNVTLQLENVPTGEEIANYLKGNSQDALVNSWAQYFNQNSEKLVDEISLEVQRFNLGENVLFVTLPGEPVAELGQKILEHFPENSISFILGYTNGLTAYLPTAEQVVEGGYESDTSKYAYNLPGTFSADIEDLILSTVESLISISRQNINSKKLTKRTGRAFFTLSSGRCGTKTLSHLLNTATNARVYHHPRPYLVNETLQAYQNNINKSQTFWRARKSVIQDAWKDDLIFGELDHNMTPFVPAIAEEIPNAKFIVLVRNPWDFVRSGMRRNYYKGHPWDSGRMRPEPTHPDFERWQTMSQFEKVCWLWNETYKRIQSYLGNIPEDRYKIVKFEELVEDPKVTKEVFAFLGLKGFDETKIASILSTPMNQQTAGDFPKAKEWDTNLHKIVLDKCKKMIMAYGYEDLENEYRKQGAGNVATHHNSANTDKLTLLFLEQEGLSTGGHLDHIVPKLKNEFNVNFFKTSNLHDAQKAIEDADIVWLEWASQLTALVTQKVPALQNKPVLCRLHGFEVFTDLPAKINWDMVDQLIFVANHKKEIFNQRFPDTTVHQTVIRNGINVDAFSVPENKKNTKNLLLLGHINYRKGLTLLIQYYHELLKRDPEFHLYVRGDWQDLRYKMAVMTMVKELELEEDITFVEEWIDDLNSWLADKSHILSFSLEESFHYAIGNGMAAGMKPVIHAWNESRHIWPQEYIFKNLEEFLEIVLDKSYQPNAYRQLLMKRNLTGKDQLSQVLRVVTEVHSAYFENSQKTISLKQSREQLSHSFSSRLISTHNVSRKSSTKRHIIIIGLKRSGTTIFWKTLRQDTRFACYDEPFRPEILSFVETGRNHKKHVFDEYLQRSDLINEYWSYMQPYEQLYPFLLGHQKRYIEALVHTSKNVCVDFVRCHRKIQQIKEIVPQAFIIHLVRDPRAFVTSHLRPYGRWISQQLPQDFFKYSGWFDFWKYQTLSQELKLSGFAHEKLLKLWKYFTEQAEIQKPDMTIQFEEFAINPEKFVSRIYEQLDIEYQPLNFSTIHPPNSPYQLESISWRHSLEKLSIQNYFNFPFISLPKNISETA